ncbi:ribosome maturation factor RimP [Methylococcus sp. ANG]|uniref:ribosome maturation factor RimP n=1 Tax=unclassified Methylococcus TaxID=2618889 RepID=UPI001C52E717|nr:ribosome maturation factor RimP [Methylococcus sp. Mc7]QXP83374.1 ribosome maturation factor RimP [Methylococcus sp. Mc7]
MRMPEHLQRLIEPVVTGLGYELAGIEFDARARILRVYIDHPDGIDLDDCSKVSYQLSGMLDVEDPIPGQYQLEISSPGLDRPLFAIEHFERFTGRQVRLQTVRSLDGQRRFKGRIAGVREGVIDIEDDNGLHAIPFDLIDKARLIPEFDI